ncbi:MAG: BrxA/BrxB family bacilliredoxin [Acidobacteria bacterium]|nr:BrxA/BrxB family bacilliredoxin [Acidobacteriota bacterium]MXZ72750.1 BrxA/BrxB family bacilliredoxin [Acidobacteriota bacterium]MYD69863.1 BrxA/BrxB family bacilliredoxin [Acidobacteriota bacterium]MYJ03739.1 BrxA/BrxB family bacilliredoxin [Acidobacteriota bacterium]
MYPEFFIAPMREELTRLGVKELRTAEAVDEAVAGTSGTLMVVVNSVCGCAAGRARPGIALALQHGTRPDVVASVFAGADLEATERARGYFVGYPPSSPSVALLRGGKLVYMMERHQIENQEADAIARDLAAAFDEHCAPAGAAVS